jgi:Protein of unknown function (DUF2934)
MNNKAVAVLDAQVKKTPAKVETQPTEQEIAQRAHELFLQRGSVGGHELEDWLQAERELQKKA